MWLRNILSRWKSSGTPPEYLEVFFGGFPDDFFPETSRFSPGHPQGSLLKNILPSIGVIGEFISLMEVSKAMAERSNVVGGWGGVLISVMSEARKEKLNKIQICQIHILQKSPILRRHRLWTAPYTIYPWFWHLGFQSTSEPCLSTRHLSINCFTNCHFIL